MKGDVADSRRRHYHNESYFVYWEETELPVSICSARNRVLTLAKHQPPPIAWLALWGRRLRTLASRSIRPKRPLREYPNAMWRAVGDFANSRGGLYSA